MLELRAFRQPYTQLLQSGQISCTTIASYIKDLQAMFCSQLKALLNDRYLYYPFYQEAPNMKSLSTNRKTKASDTNFFSFSCVNSQSKLTKPSATAFLPLLTINLFLMLMLSTTRIKTLCLQQSFTEFMISTKNPGQKLIQKLLPFYCIFDLQQLYGF